jgi:hypothetical protein
MTNTLHLKRSQYQILVLSFLPWKVEHTKNQNIYNTSPKWKEVNLFLLTDTMHSAKDKHFRSFPIGTEVLSFADSKAESSSSQHMNIFKEEGSLAPEFDIETSSGAGYSSSEMIMSLICLLKMPGFENVYL